MLLGENGDAPRRYASGLLALHETNGMIQNGSMKKQLEDGNPFRKTRGSQKSRKSRKSEECLLVGGRAGVRVLV